MKRLAARPAVFALIASVVIIAAWFQLLWTPASRAIASAHGRERVATAALFTSEQRLGHLKKLVSRSPQLTLLDQKLSSAVPDHDSIDAFIIDLNAAAQTSNVALTSLGVTPPGTSKGSPSGAQIIGLQMQVTGGYFDLQRFLGAIRDGSRLVVIDQVSMSSGSSKVPGNGTNIAASISGRLFVASAAAPPQIFSALTPASAKPGTGVLETPINAARKAAAASNASTSQTGGTP